MKKAKKLISLVLIMVVCLAAIHTASANENYLDTDNNDLFKIVKEVTLPDEYYGSLPGTMKEYSYAINEDASMAKIIRLGFDNNGNFSKTDVTGYLIWEEYYDKEKELTNKGNFNDGLVMSEEIDREWGGFIITSFKDIDGKEVFSGIREQGADFGYNMGLLRDSYSPMNMDTGMHKGGHTTFTNVMSDKKTYSFHADFTDFNDDGFALMKKDNGKVYLIKLKKGSIVTVSYNGKKIKFDQIPVIENGRTLVPLRAIFETIGAEVKWDGSTQTVKATKGDTTVKLTIGKTTAYKNGEAIKLDVPAKIVGGRTLVPVRFVSDCFGIKVDWDGKMQRVILKK